MKYFYIIWLCAFSSIIVQAQVDSDCTVPDVLYDNYEIDVTNMALREMFKEQAFDTIFFDIPEPRLDAIWEGLAAIYNAPSIKQRDSVFNLYCIHDNTSTLKYYSDFLVKVDTSFAWTKAWQNLEAKTDYVPVDFLVEEFDLTVTNFYNWSIGNFARLHTDKIFNIYSFMNKLELEDAVFYVDVDAIIGGANKILYERINGERYFDFFVEFNDCFDGCDNYRKWMFKVDNDCAVTYLGHEDFGFFDIEPLPEPVNCDLTVAVEEIHEISYVKVYPNPVHDILFIEKGSQDLSTFTIYDLVGNVVMQGVLSDKNMIDVSSIKNGVYFIKEDLNNTILGKIMKY